MDNSVHNTNQGDIIHIVKAGHERVEAHSLNFGSKWHKNLCACGEILLTSIGDLAMLM